MKDKFLALNFGSDNYAADLLRPWKIVSFLLGLSLLILGACMLDFPDWDIGVSIVMAVITYLTAGWSIRTVIFKQWGKLPLALFFAWLSIDGSYYLYHTIAKNKMLRADQWLLSTCLYIACGLIWSFQGSLKNIKNENIR